jgi:hypothetical protein
MDRNAVTKGFRGIVASLHHRNSRPESSIKRQLCPLTLPWSTGALHRHIKMWSTVRRVVGIPAVWACYHYSDFGVLHCMYNDIYIDKRIGVLRLRRYRVITATTDRRPLL